VRHAPTEPSWAVAPTGMVVVTASKSMATGASMRISVAVVAVVVPGLEVATTCEHQRKSAVSLLHVHCA